MRTWTRVETRVRTKDGNEDGSGDENECSNRDDNGDEDRNGDGNEDRICERCRRDQENGESVSGKEKKRRQERVGSVTADPGLKNELYKSSGCVPFVPFNQRFS